MSDNAVEAKLRPAVELYSAMVCIGTALIAVFAPWALLMPRSMGLITATLLVLFAALRFSQGMTVLTYQRNLRRLPTFSLSATKIPVSPDKLFIGMGFMWEAVHTQRLRDTKLKQHERFVQPGWLFRTARRLENAAVTKPYLKSIVDLTRVDSPWNPVRPLPDVGGNTCLHGVSETEQYIYQQISDRHGHLLVVGTTRVGKTRALEVLSTQDIARGDCTLVLDPKGDSALMLRTFNEAKRHNRPFYLFHLGYPELSARYNFVANFAKTSEVATRTTDPLPDGGNSSAFKAFAWRITNVVARALHGIGERPSPGLIEQYVRNLDKLYIRYAEHSLETSGNKDWRAKVGLHEKYVVGDPKSIPRNLIGREARAIALFQYTNDADSVDPVLDALNSAFRYEKTYYDRIFSGLGPFLEKITSGKVGELLSPDYFDLDDDRPILDWMSAFRTGAVVYCGFDALGDSEVASAVSNSVLSDLAAVGGQLYKFGVDDGLSTQREKPVRICAHFDELEAIIGKNFIPMVNRLGGAGFQITAYTQSGSDIENKLGSAAAARVVLDNFNSVMMFRVKSAATAEVLTKQLPEVDVNTLTMVSGVTDAAAEGTGVDFTSRNEDRVSTTHVPMLTPNDIISLPKGQCFAFINGGQLYKLRMPLLDPIDDAGLPANIRDLSTRMASHYHTSEQWWLAGSAAAPTRAATNPTVLNDEIERDLGDSSAASTPLFKRNPAIYDSENLLLDEHELVQEEVRDEILDTLLHEHRVTDTPDVSSTAVVQAETV
jgi:conjugative coupling factor TraD (TOL family)